MTYEKRTDIHRPSAPEFDPQAYDLFGCFDLNPDPLWGAEEARHRVQTVSGLVKQGWKFTSAHGHGQCGHCGAHIRYAALMGHRPTKGLIYVGETCLDNRFDLTKDEFQRLRKEAALNAERRKMAELRQEFIDNHPELVWASYAENIAQAGATVEWTYGWADERFDTEAEAQEALAKMLVEHPYRRDESVYPTTKPGTSWMDRTRMGEKITVLEDMWDRFMRYGDMSDKAYNYLVKIVGWLTDADERLAERECKNREAQDSGIQVPNGKITVEGEIVSVKWQESMYGMTLKMLVKSDEGWKVWGTVPASLKGLTEEKMKGSRVRFIATVQRSKDDALFGFYKRPTQAKYVKVAG